LLNTNKEKKENKKVLITGGAGFLGSHIADRLIELNYEVAIIDNLSTGKIKNINPKAIFYKADIRSSVLFFIFKKEQPDYVIHNAGQISVIKSFDDPIYDADINILGGLNILRVCKKFDIKKFIFASSGGTVYGNPKGFPTSENHSTEPTCPYGLSKLTFERYLKISGLNYTILRYGNVYGPRQDPYGEVGVIAIFINKFLNNQQPIIFGDGYNTRDYVYVSDIVEANIKALQSDYTGCVNIGTGIETSVNDLINLLPIPIIPKHEPPKKEQARSCLDYSLAKEVLGCQPTIDISEGIKLTYEWFKEKNG